METLGLVRNYGNCSNLIVDALRELPKQKMVTGVCLKLTIPLVMCVFSIIYKCKNAL